MAIVIVPLSLKTSAKDLQSKASYAVYSMLGTLGFHFLGGFYKDVGECYCRIQSLGFGDMASAYFLPFF